MKFRLPGQNKAGEAARRARRLGPAYRKWVTLLGEGRFDQRRRTGEPDQQQQKQTATMDHGQATIARVASLMPKSAPGDMFWKKASLSF